MKRLLVLTLAISGCSSPYEVKLSDDKSASNGPLFFFGWADPPLIPGTRLADAPHGSRVVLWNEAGFEAIVDIGDACPVLVRDRSGARVPAPQELKVIAAVFPTWPLVASTRASDYADEPRLERRFPTHILDHVERLKGAAAVDFALGDSPAGWLASGGRGRAIMHASGCAELREVGKLVEAASLLGKAERKRVLSFVVEREDLTPRELLKIVAAGEPELAVGHEGVSDEVWFAAIDEVAREPLSGVRRDRLLDMIESRSLTDRVRARVLEVPLAYPEDREAVRRAAEGR